MLPYVYILIHCYFTTFHATHTSNFFLFFLLLIVDTNKMAQLNSKRQKNKTGCGGCSIKSLAHSTTAKKAHHYSSWWDCPITDRPNSVDLILCCRLFLFDYISMNKTKMTEKIDHGIFFYNHCWFQDAKTITNSRIRGSKRSILGETTKGFSHLLKPNKHLAILGD